MTYPALAPHDPPNDLASLLSTAIEYSVIEKQDDKHPPRFRRETLGEFVDRLRAPRVTTKKDGVAIIPARFSRPSRLTEDVLYNTFIGLDLDDGKHSAEDIRALLGSFAHAVHTSFSHLHDGKGPRFRVFVFYKEPIPKERQPDVFAHFNTLFDGALDSQCKNSNRIFFAPMCPPGGEGRYEFYFHPGELFDANAVETTDKPEPQRFALPDCLGKGQRNDFIFRFVCSLVSKNASESTLFLAAQNENKEKCSPPLPDRELRQIVRSAMRYANAGRDPENLTDKGNARRLVAIFGDDIRYIPALRKWVVWNGLRWEFDEDGAIMRLAKRTAESILLVEAIHEPDKETKKKLIAHALASESAARLEAMIRLAQSEPGISINPEQLDANLMLLCVRNAVIDLRTGDVREPQREDYITKMAPVTYDRTANAPRWAKFITRIMRNRANVIAFIQRVLGYALTGSTKEQVLAFFYGHGANGKSTVLFVVKMILGDYAAQCPADSLMLRRDAGVPNDIARLRGVRLAIAVETEDNKTLAESLVKQMTGGDVVVARFLYGEFFEFVPQFKVVLAANHKPLVRGDDHAIWRRLVLIPFEETIPPEEIDKDLASKLLEEAPGILNWLIEGAIEWQRQGLNPPDEVLAATRAYRSEMDLVGNWIEACCLIDEQIKTKASSLYEDYASWAVASGEYVMGKRRFLAKLEERGFQRKQTTHAGENGLFVMGVGLRVKQKL